MTTTNINSITPTKWRYLFPFIRIGKEAWPPNLYNVSISEGHIYSWEALMAPSFKTESKFLKVAFPIVVRAIFFIVGLIMAIIDFDGEAHKNPEKMVFVFMCLYGFLSSIMVSLKKTGLSTTYVFSTGIPFLSKFAWFCYDIWMPCALATFILYLKFAKGPQEMTARLYRFNFAIMICESLLNQMTLLPCHMLFYNAVVIPAGLAYGYQYSATPAEIMVGFVVLELSYFALFMVTYIRSDYLDNHPLSHPVVEPDETIPPPAPSGAIPVAEEQQKILTWFRKESNV